MPSHAVAAAIVLSLVFLAIVPAATRGGTTPEPATSAAILPPYGPHDSIVINGDGAFSGATGVTGGGGTAEDPFVISGWSIATVDMGISISNTQSYVVMRDLRIFDDACGLAPTSPCASVGIQLMNVTHVRVSHVDVSGVSIGLSLGAARDVRVDNTTVDARQSGLLATAIADGTRIWVSYRITLDGDAFRIHDTAGFAVAVCADHSEVRSNAIVGSSTPIGVCTATNVTVSRNLVVGGTYAGIDVHYSTDVLVDANAFVNLGDQALGFLAFDSSQVTVTRNLFQGVGYLGAVSSGTDGLVVYHNNFEASPTNGTGSAGDAWDDGYPSGGNYWSDYQGVDLCSGPTQTTCTGPDGIGDTPRPLYPVGADRYPLMAPYLREPLPPGAFFTVYPHMGNGTTAFEVNASASVDERDPASALEVRWDWEDDGVWDTPWSDVKTPRTGYAAEGAYRIRMAVRDSLGLESNTTRVVVADLSPPFTSYHADGTKGLDGWFTTPVTLTLFASDALSGVASLSYRIDGGFWASLTADSVQFTTSLRLPDGNHRVDLYATDVAGNSETVHTYLASVDSVAPWLTGPAVSGSLTLSRVTVNWSATDATSGLAGYEVSVDGGPYDPVGTTTQLNLTLPDGRHVVSVRASDRAGNNVTQSTAFTIDTNPFSFSGPYGGLPTLLIVVVVLVAAFAAAVYFAVFRQRGKTPPPGNP